MDLDKLTDEKVITELVKVKGIGRWTAEMFLMFSLARPDIFPVDDLGIKKGFEKVTGKKFDKEKSAKFALKTWSPYRTATCWYLWKSLENK
jgi:DNA-3-methyladenine glycosylase II